MMISKNQLSIYIKTAREKKGYSQRELADITGLSNAEISRIESGERKKVDIENLIKIADALALGLRELLNFAGYNQMIQQLDYERIRTLAVYLKLDEPEILAILNLEGLVKKHLPSDIHDILSENPLWFDLIRKATKLSKENQIKFILSITELANIILSQIESGKTFL